jgi:MFS family permease
MFALFLLVPVIAEAPTSTEYGLGVDATRAGLLLTPGALLMLFAGPLSGILGNRLGNKVPLALGSFICAVGLGLMALNHASQLSVLVLSALIFVGVGMAFAAMPNLIVDSVTSAQTGEATGVNALVRSVGSSLGSQVVASILAASVVAGALLPTDDALTTAFLLSAGVTLVAGLVALAIPKPAHHENADLADELGAANPLGEPAVPGPTT